MKYSDNKIIKYMTMKILTRTCGDVTKIECIKLYA